MVQPAPALVRFDFEDGRFDLVVELEAKEGLLTGHVKPLFRDIQVLSLREDIKKDNVIEFFWEALVGVATGLLKNPPRNQFATDIPLSGQLDKPQTNILEVLGNVLRNAFIRAYLPKLEGKNSDLSGLDFGKGSVTEPSATGGE